MANSNIKYMTQKEAIKLEKELFDKCGFGADQLVELNGLNVATAILQTYAPPREAWVGCGPGKTGGVGLVCARYLKLFGYHPLIVYPKPNQDVFYQNLLKQCEKLNIPTLVEMPAPLYMEGGSAIIVDAVYGTSYKPPSRDRSLASLIRTMGVTTNIRHLPIISIDVPSGWNVESGVGNFIEENTDLGTGLSLYRLYPDCLVSLVAPKKCALDFEGSYHYLGGRYVPDCLREKYKLNLPKYLGTSGVMLLPLPPKSKSKLRSRSKL